MLLGDRPGQEIVAPGLCYLCNSMRMVLAEDTESGDRYCFDCLSATVRANEAQERPNHRTFQVPERWLYSYIMFPPALHYRRG